MEYVKESIVISGKYVEHTFYEKNTQKSNRISASRKIQPRFLSEFNHRRANNLSSCKRQFVRYVLSGISTYGPPLFITLTFNQNIYSVRDANYFLRTFFARLRKANMASSYLFVPEFQKSGRVHYHGFLWGFDQSYGDCYKGKNLIQIGKERSTRYFADLWKEGFVDVRITDGDKRLVYYLAKYFVKAYDDKRLSGVRLFYRSRNIPKPFKYSGSMVDQLVDLPTTNATFESSSEFNSKWFGKVVKINYIKL